jgi:hypothetical protein
MRTSGPSYPRKNLVPNFLGISRSTPDSHYRSAHVPKGLSSESKKLVIKVQVPYNMLTNKPQAGSETLFIYSKERDFVCRVNREDGPAAYDRITRVIQSKGVGGAKAYFAAELKSKDELVVKISEVLAEQPF